MRIISQGGHADLPYERTQLCSNTENVMARCDGKEYLMGSYATQEKAIKAMEMCVENYADCNFSKELIPTLAKATIGMNLITDDDLEQIKATIGGRFFFRFPTDEEVRV